MNRAILGRGLTACVAMGGVALVAASAEAQRGGFGPVRPLPGTLQPVVLCPAVPADVRSVAAVSATVRNPRVETTEAQADCGDGAFNVGADHHLEAGRPTLTGVAHEAFPERAKFCGNIVRYGVNNEYGPARDIMFNMVPMPGFDHFVKGFISTECASIGDIAGAADCMKGDAKCGPACSTLADQTKVRLKSGAEAAKCIHAEITPPDQFFEADARYMPVPDTGDHGSRWDLPTDLVSSPKSAGVEACVYGVYAVDHGEDHGASAHKDWRCTKDSTHDRPEIHPFDATWWRIPAKYGRDGFVFALFQDDSNRYSFPHCTSDHNGSTWSQAPRDVTLRIPFQFNVGPTPKRACLRHVRAPRYAKRCTPRVGGGTTCVWAASGADQAVLPLNVTTDAMPAPITEQKALVAPDGRPALLVEEPPGFESEAQVRVDGCVQGAQASGFVTVRVAVGCNDTAHGPNHPKMTCTKAELERLDRGGRHDAGDPGSGFYYAELSFTDGACP